jgi:hypothetical protein
VKFLIRDLPFFDTETTAAAPNEAMTVRAYQVVVWMSLSARDVPEADAPRFPTIIDPATNHNFLIQEDHLERWANLSLPSLLPLGQAYLGNRALPLMRVSAWIHANRPGTRDEFVARPPFRLEMPKGMIVAPRGVSTAARLPLLGLRAIVSNRLLLTIDGARLRVALRTVT